MKTLVFGLGFLGERLLRAIPDAMLSEADITDAGAVRAAIAAVEPDVVINAAGKTGRPNVDWCEANTEPTWRSNVLGPLVLSEACADLGTYLLHIGSGCVFYGASPHPGGWREDDSANPISYYSRTKYAADILLSARPNVAVARIRMPIDTAPHPRNLITKLAAYAKVVDVENSVTVVDDLVKALAALAERRATGVFHVTNPGTLRHRDLLAAYTRIVDPAHRTTLIAEDELVTLGLAVKTRSNCVLADTRLAALGIHLRPIDEALEDCLVQYARHRAGESA